MEVESIANDLKHRRCRRLGSKRRSMVPTKARFRRTRKTGSTLPESYMKSGLSIYVTKHA